MSQPRWKYLTNLGDASLLDHGGLFVFMDLTGVYPAEMENLERISNDEEERKDRYSIYRIILERCSFVDGIFLERQQVSSGLSCLVR